MDLSHIRLTKALDIIKQIKSRLDANIFTQESFVNPPNDLMLQLRQSYMVDMHTIAENLDIKQVDPLRQRYEDLFKEARSLKRQCSILEHKYEVVGAAIDIDWNEIWVTLTRRLPEQLGPQLKNAIENEQPQEKDQVMTHVWTRE